MNTIYILSSRIGVDLNTPFCGTYKEVYATMKDQYENALLFLESEEREFDGSDIDEMSAIIRADNDWYEWTITAQPISNETLKEIRNLG